jgi:hypothetical protein
MSNIIAPPPESLPTPQRLRRYSIIAVIVAAVLAVCVVLPAERGIDPTGIGSLLGLTPMGEFKVAAAEELEAELAAEDAARAQDSTRMAAADTVAASPATRSDSTSLTLRPNQGREIKLVMKQGDRAEYSWSVAGGVVSFDMHGDTVNAPPGMFHSYSKGRGKDADAGVLEAVFDGNHGWFWRNRSTATVTVTLKTSGSYSELKEIK